LCVVTIGRKAVPNASICRSVVGPLAAAALAVTAWAMRKFFAVAASSVLALVGFAGVAQASATVDLIWIDVTNVDPDGNAFCLRQAQRNCPQLGTTLSDVAVTDNITLAVIITAGAKGLQAAGVSVNYSGGLPKLSVTAFRRMSTTKPLPVSAGSPGIDHGPAAVYQQHQRRMLHFPRRDRPARW